MDSDRPRPLPMGEVFPRLRFGCVVGAVLGLGAAVWCRHYLVLARAGGIAPSLSPHGDDFDDPTSSYTLGLVGCGVFVALCLLLLVASYVLPPGSRRTSRQRRDRGSRRERGQLG